MGSLTVITIDMLACTVRKLCHFIPNVGEQSAFLTLVLALLLATSFLKVFRDLLAARFKASWYNEISFYRKDFFITFGEGVFYQLSEEHKKRVARLYEDRFPKVVAVACVLGCVELYLGLSEAIGFWNFLYFMPLVCLCSWHHQINKEYTQKLRLILLKEDLKK